MEVNGVTTQIHVRPMYTVDLLKNDFKIGRTKIYQEMKDGRLIPTKIGKLTRFTGEDVLAWLNSHRGSDKAA